MLLLELTTDKHGRQFVQVRSEHEMKAAMYTYIKNRVADGVPLAATIFCWSRCTPRPMPTGK